MSAKGSPGSNAGQRGLVTARRRVRLDGRPTISVAIASRAPLPASEAFFDRLLPECREVGMEVVVARAADSAEGLEALRTRFPDIRWVACPAESTRFDLRSAAMADADGDIVAFVDEDTPPSAGWLDHLKAMQDRTTPPAGVAEAAELIAQVEWEDEWNPYDAGIDPGQPRPIARLEAGDHVVIIGAGPGGLTPAYLLSKRGIRVTVLEADDMVGGISRTAQYKGYRFDIGGHRFFTKIQPVDDLWHEILGDEFISVPRLSRIHYAGKFFDYPLKAWNALSGLGFWRAVQIVLSYIHAHLRPSPVEENLEQWVVNRFGRRLYEIFFKTYTEKVWGIPCTEIRAEWAAQRIQNLSLAKAILSAASVNRRSTKIKTLIHEFKYPRLGPGQMWETCRDKVEAMGGRVLMRHEVTAIEVVDGVVRAVRCRTPDGEVRIEGDHFISTMPVRSLVQSIDGGVPGGVREAGDGLKYRDFLLVALILEGEDLFPDNWIYIHTPGVKVGRVQNFNNWSRAMVPEPGRTCLGMEYFCFEGDGLWTSENADLVALATRELEALGLAPGVKVVDGTVVRMPKAYPVYDSVYRGYLDTVRAYVDRIPNLHLVGRNGMHKYNNQDHSMLTSMLVIENMDGADHDVWAVNTDFEYHEEQKVRSASGKAAPVPGG